MTKPSYRKILAKDLLVVFIIIAAVAGSFCFYLEQTYNQYMSSQVQAAGYIIANSIMNNKYNNGCEALHRMLLEVSGSDSLPYMQGENTDVLVGVIRTTKSNAINNYICTDEGYFIELSIGTNKAQVVLGNSDNTELKELYAQTDNGNYGVYFTQVLKDQEDRFYPQKAQIYNSYADAEGNISYQLIGESDYPYIASSSLEIVNISSKTNIIRSYWTQDKPMQYIPSPDTRLTYELLSEVKYGSVIENNKNTFVTSINKYSTQYDIFLKGISRTPFGIISMMPPAARLWIYISFPLMSFFLIILAFILARKKYSRLEADHRIYESQIQMTRSMAHDLKTPLAALTGYAENMASESDEDKRNYYAGKIEDNAHSMASLINSILQFSKTADEYKIKSEDIEIKSLVSDCITRLEPAIKDKGLKIEITGDKTLSTDRLLLEQSINNLTDNAVKYGKEDSMITIEIGNSSLTITNIPSKPLSKEPEELLKPFVRDDESRNITKGTGLGLAIVQRDLSLLGMKLKLKINKDLFTVTVLY